MYYHINEFNKPYGSLKAAYITDSKPIGTLLGYSGNAVLLKIEKGVAVVSMPKCEGDTIALLGAEQAPLIGLSWAFGNSE